MKINIKNHRIASGERKGTEKGNRQHAYGWNNKRTKMLSIRDSKRTDTDLHDNWARRHHHQPGKPDSSRPTKNGLRTHQTRSHFTSVKGDNE